MTVSDAQKKASKKYFDNNYKQVKLSMPIKEAETLEDFCKEKKYSRAGFIRDAIKEKIEFSVITSEEIKALEDHCEKMNYAKAEFIREAIKEKIKQDNNK